MKQLPKTRELKTTFWKECWLILRHQNIIYLPDAFREGREMKANQPRNYSYPKRKFGKDETSFLASSYEKWNWLHYVEAEDSAYCIICSNA